MAQFLDDFPTVSRDQAVTALSRPGRRSSPVRVLLDECLPRRLNRELAATMRGRSCDGMAQQTRSRSLTLAVAEFDVFLTVDRNLSYQQDVSAFNIALVVLVARGNSIDDLRPLAPQFLSALGKAERGRVTLVGGSFAPVTGRFLDH